MIRVFLDANILFSASYRETSGMLRLWRLPDVRLVTSTYALTEAERNIALKRSEAADRLSQLATQVEISTAATPLQEDYQLPDKDRPILEAAVGSGCSVLLTGDMAHFGRLIGTTVEDVRILRVSTFLAEAEAG
jgi:predicted nucleic acid-binding protein